MNYRPMFVFANGERAGNAQAYDTHPEALKSAADRFRSWTMPTSYDVDTTTEPVTYSWTSEGGDVRTKSI